MARVLVRVFTAACLGLSLAPMSAHATVSGAASSDSLSSFDSNPTAWLSAHGQDANLGAEVAALAAAAVNGRDAKFGASLKTLLTSASADQGNSIGTALGNMAKGATDTGDKQYINANIAPQMVANGSANTTFGQASGTEPASVGGGGGGGGGGGSGVGGQTGTSGSANGGNNNGSTGGTAGGTNTVPQTFTTFQASGNSSISSFQ